MTTLTSKRALLIGINYRGSGYDLYGCANDQLEMYQILLRNGYSKDNILFLSDDSNYSLAKPTFDNMAKGIRWLLSDAKNSQFNEDEKKWHALTAMQLFVGYSGHGSYLRDSNNSESDGYDEVLVPCDYPKTGVTMSDDYLRKNLIEKVPKDVKLTSVIDCCHSGTMFDLRYKFTNNGKKDMLMTYNGNYTDTQGDVLMLSACLDSQTAAEHRKGNISYGLLTFTFIEYMNSRKDDTTCSDLLNHINKRVYGQRSIITMGQKRSINSKFNL